MKALTKTAGIADGFLSTFSTMTNTGLQAANMSINSKEFRKIMDTEKFDLVIVGIYTNNFLVGKSPKFYMKIRLLQIARAASPAPRSSVGCLSASIYV